MIRNNLNLVVCSFNIAPPFLEAIADDKEFFLICIIVDFRPGKFSLIESYRVQPYLILRGQFYRAPVAFAHAS